VAFNGGAIFKCRSENGMKKGDSEIFWDNKPVFARRE
jgi:hypothetical protein